MAASHTVGRSIILRFFWCPTFGIGRVCAEICPLSVVKNNLFHLDPRLRPHNGAREDPPLSHPSRGGKPYSNDTCQLVLQLHFNGTNLRHPPADIADLRLNHKFPCYSTCSSWIQTYHATGDVCPLRATGNNFAGREISGLKLEWLALYRAVLPKATLAECRAFLFNMDPNEPPYSNSQVYRAEQLLDLKRKAASTTADFWPEYSSMSSVCCTYQVWPLSNVSQNMSPLRHACPPARLKQVYHPDCPQGRPSFP